jgi:nitronate monooxygenase
VALRTAFTDLVGCRLPIQLDPMGGDVVTTELAIAVSSAGGLGMLQRAGSTPLEGRIEALGKANAGPFGVNFVLHGPTSAVPAEVEYAASHARLIEFLWADPDRAVVALVHQAGALAGWQVGSVAEARLAVDAGCDLIIAQGVEAGGHVHGTAGLLPLLADILDVVDVPVLAAGASPTARSLAAVP